MKSFFTVMRSHQQDMQVGLLAPFIQLVQNLIGNSPQQECLAGRNIQNHAILKGEYCDLEATLKEAIETKMTLLLVGATFSICLLMPCSTIMTRQIQPGYLSKNPIQRPFRHIIQHTGCLSCSTMSETAENIGKSFAIQLLPVCQHVGGRDFVSKTYVSSGSVQVQ
jgi:hypothetical protein